MNFIKANNKLINLEHVSSINLLTGRIAYDMDCPVELDSGKIISYYAYDDHNESGESVNTLLNHPYVLDNFNVHEEILVNMTQVSAVKFVQEKNRIIYNFSHSTTSLNFNREPRLTSKFVYVHIQDNAQYNEFCNSLTHTLTKGK